LCELCTNQELERAHKVLSLNGDNLPSITKISGCYLHPQCKKTHIMDKACCS